MIVFGILGYFMKLYDYPVAPMVLGVILGPLIDSNLRRAISIEHNSFLGFLTSLITHPISLTMIIFIAVMSLGKMGFLVGLNQKRSKNYKRLKGGIFMSNPNIAVLGLKHGWKFVDALYHRADSIGGNLIAICSRTLLDYQPPRIPDPKIQNVKFYNNYIKLMDELKDELDGIIVAFQMIYI